MSLQEYQIDGRHLPTDAEPTPKIYRMRIFCAKCSRREKLLLVFPKVRIPISVSQMMPQRKKQTIKEGEEGVWVNYWREYCAYPCSHI